MLSGAQSARDHVTPRADPRDRAPSMTQSDPRGQYGDVTGGQYRERYYPESRSPATARYSDSTTPPGLMMPPWNNLPGMWPRGAQCYFRRFHYCCTGTTEKTIELFISS